MEVQEDKSDLIKIRYVVDTEFTPHYKEVFINRNFIQIIEPKIYCFGGFYRLRTFKDALDYYDNLQRERHLGSKIKVIKEVCGDETYIKGVEGVDIVIGNRTYPVVDMTLTEIMELINR